MIDVASYISAPPPKGFRRAYYFTSVDYALSGIALRRLKVARFSDANDPFELLGVRLRDKQVRKAVKDFKNECNKSTGLLCFSQDWTKPILWSYYSEKHKGVCLGFDLKTDLVRDVIYEKDREMVDFDKESKSFIVDDKLRERLLLTKSIHWKPEDEVRIIVDLSTAKRDGQLYFRRFGSDMILTRVILGPNCTLDPHAVKDLVCVRHPAAIVFRSRAEYGGFKVVFNGYDEQSVAEQIAHINGRTSSLSAHVQ
jgi:hypothetical protein